MKKGIITSDTNKSIEVLIPRYQARKLLKEANSNKIEHTEIRPNVYNLKCNNESKLITFKRIWGLIEV